LIIVLVIWLISAILLTILVLMHSGKGAGLSDIIAGQLYNNTTGTGTIQKNLDRLTVVVAIIFFVSVVVLMIIYPAGSAGNTGS
jgi:preprotein translocase subunit SecG